MISSIKRRLGDKSPRSERRNQKLALLSSIAQTTRAIPHSLANPKGLADPDGFANRIAIGFAIAMINGFRFDFPKPVAGLGMIAAFSCGIAMINGFRFDFS